MKYIVYNKETGTVINIISTILYKNPVILPVLNPLTYESTINWDDIKVKDINKAIRALNICGTGWSIKEVD